MVDYAQGEFYDNIIKKRKLVIIKDGVEKEIVDFMAHINTIVKDYKVNQFDELARTILPLGKYFCRTYDELNGFLVGFFVGCDFERNGIQVRTEDMEMSHEEKQESNFLKLGMPLKDDQWIL